MDRTQAIGMLEASNHLLLAEMEKLRKLLASGCSTTDQDAPYATLEKCELEYAAVQTAIEAMSTQVSSADQVACVTPTEYILRSGFKPEDVRRVPFSFEERLSNYKANLTKGYTPGENKINGIVVVGVEDIVTAYNPDPLASVLDVLESKLIDYGMDNTSYSFVGVTGDGSSILTFVEGIDYDIAETADAEDLNYEAEE